MILAIFFLRAVAFIFLIAGAFFIGGIPAMRADDASLSTPLAATIGITLFTAALVVYMLARRLVRRWHRSAVLENEELPFDPAGDQQWLSHEEWVFLPDPVPAAPRPRSWRLAGVPQGLVPPDEVLRRLWLVRAHLVSYAASARESFLLLASIAGALCLAGAGLMAWFSAYSFESDDPVWALGAALATALMIPAILNLGAVVSDTAQSLRRRAALSKEQRRLMEIDAKRPGGAQGGPKVKAGFRNAYLSGGVYIPPAVEG